MSKRQFVQFGLKTLLLATCVLATVLGIFVWNERQRQQAIRTVTQAGGSIVFGEKVHETGYIANYRNSAWREKLIAISGSRFGSPVTAVFLSGSELPPEVLESLRVFDQIRVLILSGTNLDDSKLKRLGGMSSLEILDVFDTNVTPSGIDSFQRSNPRCKIINESPYLDAL